MRKAILKPLVLAISISLLSACGGSSSNNRGPIAGEGEGGIIGTAKVPKIISLSKLQAKSKSGLRLSSNIDSNGKFSLNKLKSGTYLLRTKPVNSGNNKYLYSIAHSSGKTTVTRNIHPFTDLILRNWFAGKSLDIDSEFNKQGEISQIPTEAEVNAIETEIEGILTNLLIDYDIKNGIDLFATPFNKDGTGFDTFLDKNSVIINNNKITLIFNQKNGNTQGISINKLPLNTQFTSDNDSPPTTPTKLRSLPASSSEIVIVWEASTDDKGVAGYNIYRNDILVGTTPYPVFTDTGLSTNISYSYQVVAIDSRAQTSSRTASSTPLTLNSPDVTPPAPATGLNATASGKNILLNWNQSQIDDVSSFKILRGTSGNVTTKIAQVTSTNFTDFNLAISNAAYCYHIKSMDAAGNESEASNEACASISGNGGNDKAHLSFSTASYQVAKNTSSIAITVNRNGNLGQAVSVHYAATGGTAVNGTDFTSTSGTLNWAANDAAPKTFSIQITSNSLSIGDKTINLSLTSPSGATVETSTATLTIKDTANVQCINFEAKYIENNTTLSAPCYNIINGIEVKNPAKLTIAPGVKLKFAAGDKLEIDKGAALYAVGTADQPIIFTGNDATPGYWKGIVYYRSNSVNNKLDHVTIEYGEVNIDNVSFPSDPARFSIKNTISRYASNLGLNIYDTSVKLDAFENVTLTANDRPIYLPANMVGLLGKDSHFSGNTDDRIHIYDSDVTKKQTWKKLDVPYFFSDNYNYSLKAAVTIEAGSKLIFNSGAMLEATKSGSLKAVGTSVNPILFTGQEPTPGYWKGIQFYRSNSSNNQLNHTTIEYGVVNIDTVSFPSDPARISIKNTISRHASDLGLNIYDESLKLGAFENVVLTKNDRPIKLPSNMVGLLGKDSHYVGNTDDRINVFDRNITKSQTWKKLDAPYFMSITSAYSIQAALTLEAGVSLTFNSGSGLDVETSGSLKAIGTSNAPIIFTGLEEAQGYWQGIEFYRSNSNNNILEHTVVEYGGSGNASDSGNIVSVCFPSDPTRFTIKNSIIKDSLGWGVFKYGTQDDGCYISLSGNAYSNNASGEVNNP